jgi:cellulose synthase operon protein C
MYTGFTSMTPARRAACCAVLLACVIVPTHAQQRGRDTSALDRARADIQRGQYPAALKTLQTLAAADQVGDAALELGLLQKYLGKREEATSTLEPIANSDAETPAQLVRAARAARALGLFEDAKALLLEAESLSPNDVAINTAWGELLLEKYNKSEAVKSFQAALASNETWVPAQVGLARAISDENPPMARELIGKALKASPSHVPALLFLAELDLDDAKREEARASIKKALQINPNSLEAHGLDAAVNYVDGKTAEYEAAVAAALKINPAYGDVYRIAGDMTARAYRFPEAEVLTRKALALDKESSRAWADLGLILMRLGDEPGARAALETAFETDPYDAVTFNLLTLLETLDTFETITDGDIIMRLHKDEAAVMREHAMPLAHQALDALSKRWEFKPQGPILIEMFPKHDDFAVRTLGLPGMIGALGACFGRVVTLDSPKARPPGEFNWGATLWHELAHVITLQMSSQRLPRWLSEGISVFEEKRARREWGREGEMQFVHAMEQNKILTVRNLNSAFSDPRTISLAYYEASLLVEHIVEAHGEAKLHDLVRSFSKGIDMEAASKLVLNVSIDQLQKTFTEFLEKDLGSVRRALKPVEVPQGATVADLQLLAEKNPESYSVHVALGQALHKAGDGQGAIVALERAAALVPNATGPDSPNVMIAAIAMERKDNTRAIAALEALGKVDHTDIESARKLASLLEPLGEPARSAAAYERIVGIDPFDIDAALGLGRHSMKRNDAAAAIKAFRTVLAANPADKAMAYTELGEAYFLAGQKPEAKKQTLAALEIAPQFERAQDLLLKLVEGVDR